MPATDALDRAFFHVDTHTISSLKSAATTDRVEARVPGQIDSLARKETRDGKPFFELSLADAEGKLTLRAWSDSPAFALCEKLAAGEFIEVSGEFAHSAAYGVESKRWTCAPLPATDRDTLLAGPPELRARQGADGCVRHPHY